MVNSVSARLDKYSMPEPNSGCLLWLGSAKPSGYGMMWHAGKSQMAHRVAWEVANGPIPTGLHVCHKCDVPSCINPQHLFLGTHSENMADMNRKRRGKTFQGERHGMAKLTEADVRSILLDTRPQRVIARDFGVTQTMIGLIKRRKNWRHLCLTPIS